MGILSPSPHACGPVDSPGDRCIVGIAEAVVLESIVPIPGIRAGRNIQFCHEGDHD